MTAPTLPFAPFAAGRPIRRRHLLRPDGGYPRSVCREASWTVKAADELDLPLCLTCWELAARVLAANLEVLEFTQAARVIRGQLDDDAWEVRKALIDEAISGDLEAPGRRDLLEGIVAMRAVAEAAAAEAVARNRVPPLIAELETGDLEGATTSAVARYLGEAEWLRRTYHPEEIGRDVCGDRQPWGTCASAAGHPGDHDYRGTR